jgi:hypothetical protein
MPRSRPGRRRSRISRHDPSGVAPSPSRFMALTPDRPMMQRTITLPATNRPQVDLAERM